MRGALLLFGAIVVLLVGVVALTTGTSLFTDPEPRERAWVESLGEWLGPATAPPSCQADLEQVVGKPPTSRLDAVYAAARDDCYDWYAVFGRVEGSLIDGHRADATTTFEPELSRAAGRVAGRNATTHCWRAGDWEPLSEQYATLGGEEFWLLGLADPYRGRIDLSPRVCDRLRPFLVDGLIPSLISSEAYELARALVVLAHEAEHLRRPRASEADVECRALQRVRALVRVEGHGAGLQEELALLAWELGYPAGLEEYRTERCYDGGPLDLHPESTVWP